MPEGPLVFDRSLVRRRRLRASRGDAVTFLLDHVAADLGERLSAVVRRFGRAADIGTSGDAVRDVLRRRNLATDIIAVDSLPKSSRGGLHVIADEEALPFADASLDLAVSVLSLHAVNDLPGTLIQIRRALKPDGLFLCALLGGDTLTELRQAFAQAESEIEGGISPRVAPFADLRDLGSLLQRAGFALPVTDVERLTVRYDDAFALMRDLRGMGMANALTERRRVPLRRATSLRMAEIYAAQFADADMRIRATFDIIWLSGWAPHESQQQPLRPGSARTRLADALGVKEISAGEKARS